jgi:hypothetical protein
VKAINADIRWVPNTDIVDIFPRGSNWERIPGDRWLHLSNGQTGDLQYIQMAADIFTILARDRVSWPAMHKAMLQIDEYREKLSLDTPTKLEE